MRINEVTKAYRKSLTMEQAVSLARQHYMPFMENFAGDPPVYRGATYSKGVAALVDPTATGRTSANTSNEYTVLMSELPSWSAYPKRSQSIVCAADPEISVNYGDSHYVVVLPEKFNLGVCSADDVWLSFPYLQAKTGLEIHEFNDHIHQLARDAGSAALRGKTSLADIKQVCDLIQVRTQADLKGHSELYGFPNSLPRYFAKNLKPDSAPGAAFELLVDLLHPKKNRFRRITRFSELENLYGKYEVWTDTACMMVKESHWQQFKNKVLK